LLSLKLRLKGFKIHTEFVLLSFGLLAACAASAQYKVKGTVYDNSRTYPIEAVSVMSSNGRGTITDSLGHYQIQVNDNDSIWFSYQGKVTLKYPVLKIQDVTQFDIALKLRMELLPTVSVRTKDYKQDAIRNRRDYAKIFDYHKPTVGSMTNIGSMGAGIDIDELIRVFQFKRNKATMRFQQRLLEQERDKFVDHRFNKPLVRRLTGLDGAELDHFMLKYRPTYEFASLASEYDFQLYIKNAFEDYKRTL